jgi:hypothetical protein
MAALGRPRLHALLSPDALAIIKRAATIEGRSFSEFVVAAAPVRRNRRWRCGTRARRIAGSSRRRGDG